MIGAAGSATGTVAKFAQARRHSERERFNMAISTVAMRSHHNDGRYEAHQRRASE